MQAIRPLGALGILNIVVAIAYYFGMSFCNGLAWLGAYDLYVGLEKAGVIDPEKLALYENGKYAADRVLGEYLVDNPTRAGSWAIFAGAAIIGINGIILCILAASLRSRRTVT